MAAGMPNTDLATNTAWSAAATITNVIGRMLIAVILARSLGPDQFGIYVFALWLVELTFAIFSVGLAGTATRFFPQTLNTEELIYPRFGTWFTWHSLFSLLLISGFTVLSLHQFSNFNDFESLSAVLAYSVFSSIYTLAGARAQGLFQFKQYTLATGSLVLITLTGLVFLRSAIDIKTVFLVLAASNLCSTFFLLSTDKTPASGSERAGLSQEQKRHITTYAKNTWITSLGGSLLWSRGELPIVKMYEGVTAVGFYSVGLTVSGLVNQTLSLLTGALWPKIAQLWDRKNHSELEDLFYSVTSILLFVAGISVGFIVCFSEYIVHVFFGEAYQTNSNLIAILSLGALGLISGCGNLILQASTNGQFTRNLTFGGIALLFGFAFFLTREYGLEGAAAARSITQVVIAIAIFWGVSNFLNNKRLFYMTLRAFLYLIVLAIVLVALRNDLSYMGPLIMCTIYVCYCLLTLWISSVAAQGKLIVTVRRIVRL
jgi:O-antigen/teichoic acid export membrane protein